MNEEELLDLIEKDMSGRLSADERARLKALLDADQEALNLHRRMIETGETLKRVTDVDAPAGLKQRIMDSIDPRRYQLAGRSSQTLPMWRILIRPRLRLVYAFAVGILIGVIVYSQIVTDGRITSPSDFKNLYGTIAGYEAGALKAADSVSVELPEVSGKIRLLRVAGLVVVEQELRSEKLVEVRLAFDPSIIRFEGFSTPDAFYLKAVSGEGWLRVEGAAKQAYIMTISRPGDLPTELRVEVGLPGEAGYRTEFAVVAEDRL